MPSSPGPTEFRRTLQRFFYRGISLQPQDALAEGKLAWIKNMRSYMEGTIEPRYGLAELTASPVGANIHSIFRLNDPTPFAMGNSTRRVLGSGTSLYMGTPGVESYSVVDTGFSGDPFTGVVAEPFNSPRPYLYLADSARMRKVNTSLTDYPIGIAQPNVPAGATLGGPEVTYLDPVHDPGWTSYGPNVAPLAPTPAPVVDRVNTVVDDILYDTVAPGMASVVLEDFAGVTIGASLDVGAVPETVIVHKVCPAVSPTTIAGILYDAGSLGPATIQPAGGFSVGQIEVPTPAELERHDWQLDDPQPPRLTLTRTVDFPVDCLIEITQGMTTERVRIESVAVGPSGVMSFRAVLPSTFTAGATITGIPSIRAYFTTTKSIGDPVVQLAYEVVVTPADAEVAEVGGVQGTVATFPTLTDWTRVGDQAMRPEDIIRLGVRVSLMGFVESIRLTLDVTSANDSPSPTLQFLTDYYFYEWRAADLVTAIQATGEVATGLVADAQTEAVSRGETDAVYRDQFGYGQSTFEEALDPVRKRPTGRGRRQTDVVADRDDTGRMAVPRGEPVGPVVGGGLSRQLALGNDVWIQLECRVGDLIRVGSDTTKTLSTIDSAAIWAQVKGTTDAITLSFSDVYLLGGFGPDVGTVYPPYVYRYSYRSTLTGERSNPSPPMRYGMDPRRGFVNLGMTASTSPQVDKLDVWRFGGTLARWTYVGSTDNIPAPNFTDTFMDSAIDGGEELRVDRYQPWPTTDLPRSGTCTVVGTSVLWTSGDLFNTAWAPGTAIIVNGVATSLHRSPVVSTKLELVDSCEFATDAPFFLPSPTLLSQPLPSLWGGPIQGVWFHFGCGDANNPGVLYWTHGNDPDAASDRNTLVATSSSEPLMHGWIDDGIAYVFSTERLYRIVSAFGSLSPFLVTETNCTKGLWSRWGFAPDPDGGGAFFVRPDGIYRTVGGSDAQNVTHPDLQPLFGQDGTEAEPIRNLNPIDFTDVNRLRLAIVGRYLYFDYVDTTGEGHTLVLDKATGAWTPDAYVEEGSPPVPTGVTVRLSEPGPEVYEHVLALETAQLYEYTLDQITDVLTPVFWEYWTPWAHGEDPRAWKQWGDAVLDFHPGGSVDGIAVTPVVDNGNVLLNTRVVGAGGMVRDTYLIEVGTVSTSLGYGVISRNCGLQVEGNCQACDDQRPIFYLWEPSYLWKGMTVARRATDWEDLGYKGAKFVQGVVIRANTFGQNKLVAVQYDGPNATPQTALTLTLNHNGEQAIAYPLSPAGWTPFIAELVRLQGSDLVDWVLLDWRFVFEPAPELATQWETQFTTFDLPGFSAVHDGIVAYQSTTPVSWFIEYQDGFSATYVLPSSGGAYFRTRQITQAQKGKAVRFRWTAAAPFRLFKRDCSVRVQGWGLPGGYQIMNPFGGPHRVDGAEI